MMALGLNNSNVIRRQAVPDFAGRLIKQANAMIAHLRSIFGATGALQSMRRPGLPQD
jgi:hypothetical protein